MILDDVNILGPRPALISRSDSAVVPPPPSEFGYTSIGVSTATYDGSQYLSVRFTASAANTYNFINVYMRAPFHAGPEPFSVAVFSAGAFIPDVLINQGSDNYFGSFAWYKAPCTFSVTPGTDYYLCIWGSVHFEIAYDAGAAGQTSRKFSYTYPNWDDPCTLTNLVLESDVYSIYASEV